MSAAAAAMIFAVVLIVLALVVFLVGTILQLRKIVAGLDRVIVHVGGIVEKSAPVNEIVADINANLDAGVAALEGLLVKKAGMSDAVGLVEGIYPGAAAAGLRDFPESKDVVPPRIGEVYTKGTLTLARLGREAPIAAASPRGAVLRNIEGGSLAARMLYPTAAQVRGPRSCRAHRSSAPIRPSSTSGVRTSASRASSSRPAVLTEERSPVQTPAPFEYERATSVDGAIASLERLGAEARIIAGGHSLLPMMKLRLAQPEHLIDINDLHELAYIREEGGDDQGRRAHAPRRPAQVRPARPALPAVPRRRGGHRRPGGAQPRHDRRLAVPGRRGRGPLRGVQRRQGARDDPRQRGRARGRHGRLPHRPVHDRGRRRRDPHRDPPAALPGAGSAHEKVERRAGDWAIAAASAACGSRAASSPRSGSRSARSG